MNVRGRALACLVAVGAVGAAATMASAGGTRIESLHVRPVAATDPGRPSSLEIYYTPPVLVRRGEGVRIPVQVVCATTRGRACDAEASISVRDGDGSWRTVSTPSTAGLAFDLTAPASRAQAASPTGTVSFTLGATAGDRSAALGTRDDPLSFFVVRDMPVLDLPALPFGETRRGQEVLTLPWGTGSLRAGLIAGHEGSTLGPSSFDVDAAGRIYLADAIQHRVAVFADGRLLWQARMAMTPLARVAADGRGGVYVADQVEGAVQVRHVAREGGAGPATAVGTGILSGVRTTADGAAIHLLPQDQWVRVSERDTTATAGRATTAAPAADGAQLSVASMSSVRLARLQGGKPRAAVELRTGVRFGELELAEPAGSDGYLAVVRVWRESPRADDQFQVVRIVGSRVTGTFAVSSASYAEVRPGARFRIGPDGALYELTSSPAGISIERYEMEGGR